MLEPCVVEPEVVATALQFQVEDDTGLREVTCSEVRRESEVNVVVCDVERTRLVADEFDEFGCHGFIILRYIFNTIIKKFKS